MSNKKIKIGAIVIAKGRVGEVRGLFSTKGRDRAFVYFPYEHENDSMRLLGYEQNWNIGDLRVATAAEKRDFRSRQKQLKQRDARSDDMRRRYVLEDPSINANKFWEVEQHGSAVTTHWGRIGAAAASKTKDFGTEEKASVEVEKLIRQKEKKGYKYAQTLVKPSAAKSGKKGKRARGKKCAHCGSPSPSPTECATPEEHSYYAKGCKCAFCNAHFNKKLTSSEINWLAQHGWSSAQIKKMEPAEARRLIAAGESKVPGPTTALTLGGKELEQYRADLLKTGISAGVSFRASKTTNGLEKLCGLLREQSDDGWRRAHKVLDRGAVASMATAYAVAANGVFSDGRRVFLVIPSDEKIVREFCEGLGALSMFTLDKSIRGLIDRILKSLDCYPLGRGRKNP